MDTKEAFKLERKDNAEAVYLVPQYKKPDSGDFHEIPMPVGQDHVWVGLVNVPQTRPRFDFTNGWDWLEGITWLVALALLLGAGIGLVKKLWDKQGGINLAEVVSEPNEDGVKGKASLGRLQALLFTFVFLIAFMLVVMKHGDFPKEIPPSVLLLLGGSLVTYLAGKTKWFGGDILNIPTITNPGDQTNEAGDSVKLQINATGATPLTFNIIGLPKNVTSNNNGLVSGTIDPATTSGTSTVTVSVIDGLGRTSSPISFKWTVQ